MSSIIRSIAQSPPIHDATYRGSLAPLYMLFELAYESLIFILTMGRTVYLYKFYPVMSSSRRSLMECFIKGGAIYYS